MRDMTDEELDYELDSEGGIGLEIAELISSSWDLERAAVGDVQVEHKERRVLDAVKALVAKLAVMPEEKQADTRAIVARYEARRVAGRVGK